jgi:hypothetical protein
MKLAYLVILTLITTIAHAGTEGQAGKAGTAGAAGAAGASGQIVVQGLRCIVSSNVEHLRMCLDEGKSVNQLRWAGESIFQVAVKSHGIEMLQTLIEYPDPNNRPDLRQPFKNVTPGTPELNTYELLLYGRAFKNKPYDPAQLDRDQLKDMLYVDPMQVEQLKLILSIETNKAALEKETREILIHLQNSKYLEIPSVQEAIKAITDAIS